MKAAPAGLGREIWWPASLLSSEVGRVPDKVCEMREALGDALRKINVWMPSRGKESESAVGL